MTAPRTSGKVVLHNAETGEQVERWPVDAREMLSRGGWSLTADGEPPVTDVEAGLRVQAPASSLAPDAALVTDPVLHPAGGPLLVVREGVAADPLGVAGKPKAGK